MIRCIVYCEGKAEEAFEVASLSEVADKVDEKTYEIVDCAGW